MSSPRDTVLVLDFGAQYAQLIARRIREAHVYAEIVPYRIGPAEVLERGACALVLSGGPASVYSEGAPRPDPGLFSLGLPVLGICYGQQLMAEMLGGRVARTGAREYGRTRLRVLGRSLLLEGLPDELDVWMSHSDTVVAPPPDFKVVARTEASPAAVFENPERRLFGVQFHPEVVHTERGMEILKNFLFKAAGASPSWTAVSIVEEAERMVRDRVGDGRALCALSGGVDSAVAALIAHRALGTRLTCVFVDTGLLRQGEPEQVEATFRRHFRMNLVHVKAAERFLSRLKGVTDPEEKRRRIGEEFVRVFEEVAMAEAEGARFLVQGTLYPDVIESGGREAARIKTHHNVGGLPRDMSLEVVEPLRNLFKDEVRAVGEELGLPEDIVWRQPFPGPGLAVRILGEVDAEKLSILRAADAIVAEEVRRAGLQRELWQYFAVLPGVRTVGVMGDARSYAYPIVVRAVTSEDAMTADWARLPHEFLDRLARRLVGEVPGINRVVYDITSKPPGTIEWE